VTVVQIKAYGVFRFYRDKIYKKLLFDNSNFASDYIKENKLDNYKVKKFYGKVIYGDYDIKYDDNKERKYKKLHERHDKASKFVEENEPDNYGLDYATLQEKLEKILNKEKYKSKAAERELRIKSAVLEELETMYLADPSKYITTEYRNLKRETKELKEQEKSAVDIAADEYFNSFRHELEASLDFCLPYLNYKTDITNRLSDKYISEFQKKNKRYPNLDEQKKVFHVPRHPLFDFYKKFLKDEIAKAFVQFRTDLHVELDKEDKSEIMKACLNYIED